MENNYQRKINFFINLYVILQWQQRVIKPAVTTYLIKWLLAQKN